jgi:hypothetical protein
VLDEGIKGSGHDFGTMGSKAMKENERYLARTKKSMQAEADVRIARQQARENKERDRLQRDADRRDEKERQLEQQRYYDESIAQKNCAYAQFWISTVGVGVPAAVHAIRNGLGFVESNMKLRVYNKGENKQEDHLLLDMITLVIDTGLPPLENDARGQVHWYGNLYVAADIYNFISFHWNQVGPSLLPSSTEC